MIEAGTPPAEIRQTVTSFRLEPSETRLHRIAEQASALAGRLQKEPLEGHVESNGLKLEPRAWAEFWSAAVHVVRNAIDHGIETAEERAAIGKSEPAQLALRTRLNAQRFTVEFADNGRGIDWQKVAQRARKLGLPADSPSDLTAALFAEGLSTLDVVSEMSGRGVGLAIAQSVCQSLGGDVEVDSELGKGTTIRFVWPAHIVSGGFRRPALVLRQPSIASRHRQPSQIPSAGS
jgi:chemotaxis protein histidine kinase CheA